MEATLAAVAALLAPPNLAALAAGLALGLVVAVLPGLTLVMGVVLGCPSPTPWA